MDERRKWEIQIWLEWATAHDDDTRFIIIDGKRYIGNLKLYLLTGLDSEAKYDDVTTFYEAEMSRGNTISMNL